MAVETRVVKKGQRYQVDMRNVEKGFSWMKFRTFSSKKAADHAADVMTER